MAKKPSFHRRKQPEKVLQDEIAVFLRQRGWMVENMHGNAFQKGVPDLYCYNEQLDLHRWVDVKREGSYKYTKDQCQTWPGWKPGVWIMMGATDEWYHKLFEPCNFMDYWKPAYDKYLLDPSDVIKKLDS
jgi:hypothetical protein